MTESTESEEYGFIAHLEDDGVVHMTDCMGGGERLSFHGRDDLIDAIEDFIKSRAREYAEAMAGDLDEDREDEAVEDEAPAGVKA